MRALCLLACARAALGAPNLASDHMRFGKSSVADSIGKFGNLEQPFYVSGVEWKKLTYSTYAIDFKAEAGGVTLTCSDNSGCNDFKQTFSNDPFTIDTSELVGTVGSIRVTSTVGDITLERVFTIKEASAKLMTCSVRIINNGASPVANARAWFGTRDDYVGTTDNPSKRTGALTGSSFVYSAAGGNTVEIKSGSEVVYLISPSEGSAGIISDRCAAYARPAHVGPPRARSPLSRASPLLHAVPLTSRRPCGGSPHPARSRSPLLLPSGHTAPCLALASPRPTQLLELLLR